ncbi:MAG: ABC transporter ATP-binding protein [Lachnospiraceae bacterium]|nr:ABC transporter ATP-binding protein [Lachnospiraceae bacterium]
MIRTEGLSKKFRKVKDEKQKTVNKKMSFEFYAVDHVTMQADAGEILGVLGPNGAGKTTLLRMLGNLMKPTEGEVVISDQEGGEITDQIRIKTMVGYLSGNTKLYHRFSTREMLSTIAEIYGIPKEEQQDRIKEICAVLDMESFIDNRIERLSTGQTQRANIARCLIHKPQIYIFDEPTLGLDIISSESIIQFMKKERERGKTVIYSTHYMEEAQYLCDRIVMLYRGKIIAEGTPEQLMRQTDTTNLRETFRALIEGMGGEADE